MTARFERFRGRKALLIVDYENDFVDPEGSLYVTGAEKLLLCINALISFARSHGWLIIFSRDWHPRVTSHFAEFGGMWPVHCVAGTWGAEFYHGLDVRPEDMIISKATKSDENGYSAFGENAFVEGDGRHPVIVLNDLNIDDLESCGVATDYCDKDSNIDGVRFGFRVRALLDCMAAVNLNKNDGEKAVIEMLNAGVRMGTSQILMRAS